MGRWAESEFDRVLVDKVKQLVNSCRDPLVDSSNVDLRFRTFVRTLDPTDKAIQACFRSLIQQSHISTVRSRRNRRPISDYIADLTGPGLGSGSSILDPITVDEGSSSSDPLRARSPPPRQHTRAFRVRDYARDAMAPLDPLPSQSLLSRMRAEPGAPITYPRLRHGPRQRTEVAPLLPRTRPTASGTASGSSASRAQSPSHMRRLGLDPSAATFVPGAQARAPSPPSAASRAWLDEYAPGGAPAPDLDFDEDEDEADMDAEAEAFLYRQPIPQPYVPGAILGAAARRRRLREEEDEEAFLRQERRQRRRLTRPLRTGPMTGEEADEIGEELEAMFGAWDREAPGEQFLDDETDPGIILPGSSRPQPAASAEVGAAGESSSVAGGDRPPSVGARPRPYVPFAERMRESERRMRREQETMEAMFGGPAPAGPYDPEDVEGMEAELAEMAARVDAMDAQRDRRRDGVVIDLTDDASDGGSAFDRAMRASAQALGAEEGQEVWEEHPYGDEAAMPGYYGSVDWHF